MPKLLWVFVFVAIVWAAPLPLQLLALTFGIVPPINLRGSRTMDILFGVTAIANALMAATGSSNVRRRRGRSLLHHCCGSERVGS
jgi:hypothetical protein